MDMLSDTSGYEDKSNDYVTLELRAIREGALVICIYKPINPMPEILQSIRDKLGHNTKINRLTLPPYPIIHQSYSIDVEKYILPKDLLTPNSKYIQITISPGGLHPFIREHVVYKQTAQDVIDEVKIGMHIDNYDLINKWREAGFPLVWNTSARHKKQQFIQVIDTNEFQKTYQNYKYEHISPN